MLPYDPATVHLTLGVLAFASIAMLGLTIYLGERSYRANRHAIIQGLLELQRGTREIQQGLVELRRLQITIGGMVYQEDEKTRALITARFDEMLRLLPR